MDLEIDVHDLEKGLRTLFSYAFITNCSLDDESITTEESLTLKELETSEVLENFKDLVLNILKFKKESKLSTETELITRNNQFESGLQKLEAEVRNHIRIEHQLKLHIETSQQRINELEQIEISDKQKIKELEEKNNGKKTSKKNDLEI